MPSAEYDLWYLRAGVEQLESYLLSKDIYWSIGTSPPVGEPPYPQLTLGWLLFANLRAQSTCETPEQRNELDRIDWQLKTVRTRRRAAWGLKAYSEFKSRLTLWRNFLEDYRKKPEANYDRYAYEVARRVILHLLESEADDIQMTEIDMLNGLDQLLRVFFVSGDFVWDEILTPSFPEEPYWYLYGNLPKPLNTS